MLVASLKRLKARLLRRDLAPANDSRGSEAHDPSGAAQDLSVKGRPLVASRPARFAPREYEILDEDDERIEAMFQRLRGEIIRRSQYGSDRRLGRPPPWRAEFGRLGSQRSARSYCYVQPWNEQGWLFERMPMGWVIAPANKNEVRDTFLRTNLAWDAVTLFRPEGDPEGLLRLKSSRLGEELVSYPVYEDMVLSQLGLANIDRQA
jgi:hypothetical protein